MNYTRPNNVPEDATFIPPVQMSPAMLFPTGSPLAKLIGPENIQAATISVTLSLNAHANAQADLRYAGAIRDWLANKAQYEAYGMKVPPQPAPPVHITTHVLYSLPDGSIVSEADGGNDGLHGAWIWQTTQ